MIWSELTSLFSGKAVGWDQQTDVLVGRRSRRIGDSPFNSEPTVVRFAPAHHDSRDLVATLRPRASVPESCKVIQVRDRDSLYNYNARV